MTDTAHPDATLSRLLANPKNSELTKSRFEAIHALCASKFTQGERNFPTGRIGKELEASGVIPFSTYAATKFPEYRELVQAWQDHADSLDFVLDTTAAEDHPDSVVARLLADPKRRGGAAATLRSIYKVCRDRFYRGELNFSPAAVSRDGEQAGTFTDGGLRGGIASRGYGELLDAWQKLSDQSQSTSGVVSENSEPADEDEEAKTGVQVRPQRFRASLIGLPDDDPMVVLDQLLKERSIKKSTIDLLNHMQEVCQSRFEQGKVDFGRSASARAFIEAKVFASDKSLTSRLAFTERFARLLDAWQAKADSQWIDFSPDLAPTNPHAVFRRLREKPFRADMQETLLGLHRVCYVEHTAGNLDFSVMRVGKLLEAQGLLSASSIRHSIYDDIRTLAKAWDEFARPWLTAEGAPPPSVRTNRRKSHNPDLEWVRRDHPEFEEFRVLASEWLQTVRGGMGQKLATVNAFFSEYLTRNDVPKTPGELLRRGQNLPEFAEVAGTPKSRETRNNHLHEFFEWVLLRDYSVEADDGELLVSTEFRNPLKVATRAGRGGHSQTPKSPLPYGYIHTLRRMVAQGPNFSDWKLAQSVQGAGEGEIGRPSTEWFEVERSQIDEEDPDCVWRKRTVKTGRVLYEMWSPVRWVAVHVKLLTPLRTGQVRMLDSGESDTWKLDAGQWALNHHPLADGTEKDPWQQGVLRRVWEQKNHETAVSTVLYISTNKTADMDKDGPYKGYVMAWHAATDPLDNVYYWLEKLRNWQAKYNPIKRRTAWLELGGKHINAKTDEQLRSYADTCFLFRQPEELPEYRGLPITDAMMSYAWFNVLEALQDELAAKGETHADGSPIIFVIRDEKGRIERNDFPLHSLRVSLITALALDGGVPFEILQKLVGHTRLMMTLYYTKVGHAHMTATLSDAAAKLDATKEASTIRFLRHTKHDELIKRAIANNSAALSAAIPIHPAERNPAGWMLMHHGLCLVGGNVSEIEDSAKIGGCYNGGPFTGTATKVSHGPVPGGARNCVRCRWFVTEPHYLQSLSAHFNNVAYRFDEARNRAVSAERTLQELRRANARAELADEVFPDSTKIDAAERYYETTAVEFSDRAEDLVATWRLIERCIGVLNAGTDADGGTQLVIQGSEAEVKAVFEEVDSELLQLSGVCDDLQLYPDLDPGKAVLRRSQLLDSALYNEGLPPMFMTLGEEDQLKLGNALMQRLSRAVMPDNPFIGKREIVRVMDAGEKLGKSLGIDLRSTLTTLRLSTGTSQQRLKHEAIEA